VKVMKFGGTSVADQPAIERLIALVHNTVRGAAGAAILNAELLKARNLLP